MYYIYGTNLKPVRMILKPPQNLSLRDMNRQSVFLAGSIEMGNADNWQPDLEAFFEEMGYNVFNPRRDDWDASWKQDFENPQFAQQVNWELDALGKANLIIMYLDPGTKSPISLLELGLYASSGKMKVVCPQGFWRKGNVDIVCSFYDIPLFESLHDLKNSFMQAPAPGQE